jgi:hypothetical protein
MPRFGHSCGITEAIDLSMEAHMTLRTALAAIILFSVAGISAAQAEIVVGGNYFPDRDEQAIIAACRGLEAQSRMSLSSDVPDDVYNGDTSSEYQLKDVPFTLRDCREAGIR